MIEILSARCGCLSIPELLIRPGVIAVTGPNGSGKTTLLEMIAGIVEPAEGTVLISGRQPRDTVIGWVCEQPDLNITFTRVVDEIASPLRFAHLPQEAIRTRVDASACAFGLIPLLDRAVRTLSGGEKVLVALAAALISSPALLILDETDSHLDAETIRSVDQIISRSGVPLVLYATHRPDRVARADRVIVMREGSVLREGTSEEVYPGPRMGGAGIPDSFRSLRNPALWRAVHAVHP